MTCPAEQTWCTKIYHACNYLQGNEGNVDPQHLSFLHVAFGAQNSLDPAINDLIAGDVAPQLDIEETAYGYRIFAIRNVGSDKKLVRITNFIMPNSSAFDGVPLFNPRKSSHQPKSWLPDALARSHRRWRALEIHRALSLLRPDRQGIRVQRLFRRLGQDLSFATQRAKSLPAGSPGDESHDLCRRRPKFLRSGFACSRDAGPDHGSFPRTPRHDRPPDHPNAPAIAAKRSRTSATGATPCLSSATVNRTRCRTCSCAPIPASLD